MVLFDYEDYILRVLLASDSAKNILSCFMMSVTTMVIRFHLSIILSLVLMCNYYLDLIVPIGVNVLISMGSGVIYNYVATHKNWYDNKAKYFIDEYSIQKAIIWKRWFLLTICCYILLVIFLIQVDNILILISTIQSVISFIICDIIENKLGSRSLNRIAEYWWQPQVKILQEEVKVIQQYKEVIERIEEKPKTPPRVKTKNE